MGKLVCGYAESKDDVAVKDWIYAVYDEMLLSPSTICFEIIDVLEASFHTLKIHFSRRIILAVFLQGTSITLSATYIKKCCKGIIMMIYIYIWPDETNVRSFVILIRWNSHDETFEETKRSASSGWNAKLVWNALVMLL
ncbi:hypothetical protein WUBG_08471 [Wuchereria bancrofti]|uniref:Uncharacterized protein n=1 Tax=Wuchereria bancrofti TaxID=6293 RepID=J9EU23_WUCBA|nr:hypothetical protein WUBG_08471 [Wuchereria bancrofti]